ncbi:unnamed protein product [Cuscuta epithymum]|uniref:Uncharacterized protein n=1 Tax=Cuscuta epithymum TaxID=186058 RepID=A0AAV0DVR5_9ASTE|nr:unnamed protein product [Cuscuta epithymum]
MDVLETWVLNQDDNECCWAIQTAAYVGAYENIRVKEGGGGGVIK